MVSGQLHRKEIDIGTCDLTITQLRSLAVDFNMAISESHQKIFVSNPEESLNWTAFIEPLTYASWATVIAFLCILPFFLTFVVKAG